VIPIQIVDMLSKFTLEGSFKISETDGLGLDRYFGHDGIWIRDGREELEGRRIYSWRWEGVEVR